MSFALGIGRVCPTTTAMLKSPSVAFSATSRAGRCLKAIAVSHKIFAILKAMNKRIFFCLLVCIFFSPLALAQTFWASVSGAAPSFSAQVALGAGLELPLGVATVGLELTPWGVVASGENVYGLAVVLRDVPLPFTPISLRAAAGLERFSKIGPFDSAAPLWYYIGGGGRYVVFGPLAVFADARIYLNNANAFRVLLGLDLRF